MAYCGPRGIALSDFLAWSEEDQQAALQWAAWESRRCPGCRTHPEDWDPAQGGSRSHQHWHPQVCIGCQKKQAAEEALQAEEEKTRGIGLVAAEGSPAHCPVCKS